MYCAHFGLTEQPFGLTPNTAYFLNTPGHLQALNMLRVALANGEGFIKVVGEVGTGKTLLCRHLLNTLDSHFVSAYIPNPFLSPAAFFRALAAELGAQLRTRDGINEYQKMITEQLMAQVAAGRKVVLMVDEAQAMPEKTLEALRLLSNLETETTKLIHIVLFGQPELDTLLARPGLRQLRQRISFSCLLTPLDRESVRQYVNHRLGKSGYNGVALFSPRAITRLTKASGGIPRLINILAHKALMSAYGKGDKTISTAHIKAAIADTEDACKSSWWQRVMPTWRLGLSAAAVLIAVCGVVVWWPGVVV